MTQLEITAALKNTPVSVQNLLGGRFVRVTIYGPVMHTEFTITAQQAIALAQAMADYKTNTRKPLAKNRANH